MDDAGSMRGGQGVGDLDGVFQGLARPQPFAPDQLVQRFARHELHGDVLNRLAIHLLGVDVVDGDDVGVVQRGGGLSFLNEALLAVGAGQRGRRQNLDGDRAVQARIYSFVHNAHSARADLRLNTIGPERGAYHGETHSPRGAHSNANFANVTGGRSPSPSAPG